VFGMFQGLDCTKARNAASNEGNILNLGLIIHVLLLYRV
jgi:hypothetical protein